MPQPDRSSKWRLREVVGEGIRNAAHGGPRSLFLVGLLAVLAAVAVLAEATTLQSLRDEEVRLWREGSHVVVVGSEGGINGTECESLSESGAVEVSGAARRASGTGTVENLGGPEVTLTEGTVGVLAMGDRLAGSGSARVPPAVVLALPAADSLGVSGGEMLTIASDGTPELPVTVDEVRDLFYATNRYSTGVFSVVPAAGIFDTCFLLAAPGYLEIAKAQVSSLSVLPDHASDASIRLLLRTEDGVEQLRRRAESRVTRWGGLVAGIVAGLVWVLMMMLRRTESGLYRTLGVSFAELILLRLSEGFLLAVIGLGVAATAAGVVSLAMEIRGELFTHALTAMASVFLSVFVLIALLAGPLSWRGDMIRLVKDR
jgi:hypothetical protein